jgi:hypothetical protein
MSVIKNNQTFTDPIQIKNGADLNNSTTLNNNSLEFSYMGGDQYIFISNTVGNPAIEIAEYPSSNSNSKLTSNSLTFNDNNNPTDSLTINQNSLNFLYDGGYREVFLGNFAGSQELLIADASNNVESKLTATSLTFNDNSTFTNIEYNVSGVTSSGPYTISASDIYTVTQGLNLEAGTTCSLTCNNGINLNSYNLITYSGSYTLPICYSHKMASTIDYSGLNNTWSNQHQSPMSLPSEFFNAANTFNQYKIEFSINMRQMTNPLDKALAMYFEFIDTNGAVYTPFVFNQQTPFTRHSNASTYSDTSFDMITFTWTDYVDFSGINATDLNFSLWWYGDLDNVAKFDAVVSLTRTNLI